MKYKANDANNFCRVFELPESYPPGFLFGGGKPVNFILTDWFNPVSPLELMEVETAEVDHDELVDRLVPFLQGKNYVKPGRDYLVICDFGAAFMFQATA